MLTLHNLKPSKNSQKTRKRVGRGNASGTGTYSSRGMKGQRSRSGGKSGLKLRGLKMNLLNIPKLRGFKSIRPSKVEVKLGDLNEVCKDGDAVTPEFLKEKGLVKHTKHGIKVLATGELTKKINVSGVSVSKGAKEIIEKLGGTIK